MNTTIKNTIKSVVSKKSQRENIWTYPDVFDFVDVSGFGTISGTLNSTLPQAGHIYSLEGFYRTTIGPIGFRVCTGNNGTPERANMPNTNNATLPFKVAVTCLSINPLPDWAFRGQGVVGNVIDVFNVKAYDLGLAP